MTPAAILTLYWCPEPRVLTLALDFLTPFRV